jgi:GDP-4-dehydro-6-deoxy-D-mannose reductase
VTDRVLVTGAGGFVGTHLMVELGDRAVPAKLDVTDAEALVTAVRSVRPAAVVHLAARSSVAESWSDAPSAWRVNVLGTVHVLGAVRAAVPDARLLVASTGEVYGRAGTIPTPEDAPLAPISPYAASKAAAEIACGQGVRADGLDVVVVRAFSQMGPGQGERFAVGSWVRQIARLEASGGGAMRVGDLTVRRDLTDVRDACAAYRRLLDPNVPAGTYNLASGTVVTMREVLEALLGLSEAEIEVQPATALRRPGEIETLAGDPSLLRKATGWLPAISLETSLADALAEARTLVKSGMNVR